MKFPTFFTVDRPYRGLAMSHPLTGNRVTFDFNSAVFTEKEIAIVKMHRALSRLK